MRTADARAALASMRRATGGLTSELGERGDAAYLRISRKGAHTPWAVVWSPGDSWFSLDLDGGFSLNHFEEDTPNDEAFGILERYVALAVEYVRTAPEPVKAGRLSLPAIRLSTAEGDVLLRESLVGVFRRVLGINRRT